MDENIKFVTLNLSKGFLLEFLLGWTRLATITEVNRVLKILGEID